MNHCMVDRSGEHKPIPVYRLTWVEIHPRDIRDGDRLAYYDGPDRIEITAEGSARFNDGTWEVNNRPTRFTVRPKTVEAHQYLGGPAYDYRYSPTAGFEWVEPTPGSGYLAPGDWVVIDPDTDPYVLSDADFQETFQP